MYDLRTFSCDNCSENTGELNGVGKQIQDERIKEWDRNRKLSPETLSPLIQMGCVDHVMNLVSKNFSKALHEYAKTFPF